MKCLITVVPVWLPWSALLLHSPQLMVAVIESVPGDMMISITKINDFQIPAFLIRWNVTPSDRPITIMCWLLYGSFKVIHCASAKDIWRSTLVIPQTELVRSIGLPSWNANETKMPQIHPNPFGSQWSKSAPNYISPIRNEHQQHCGKCKNNKLNTQLPKSFH